MPRFEVSWKMYGSATIEADDADEAEEILQDGLNAMDTTMFEEFWVSSAEMKSVEPVAGGG